MTAEPRDGALQPVVELDLGLPPQLCPRHGDVWLTDGRVVLGSRDELDLATAAGEVADALGELKHGELVRVAKVDRACQVAAEQQQEPANEVVHVADAAGL